MQVTLKSILKQPYMNSAEVIGDEKNLTNLISDVSFYEDAMDSLGFKKNTAIIAGTRTLFSTEKKDLKELFTLFAKVRASCVLVKHNRFLDSEVRRELRDAVEDSGVPVVILPKDTIWSAVIRGIEYEIMFNGGYDFSMTYENNFIQEMVFTNQDRKTLEKQARMFGITVNEYLCAVLIRSPNALLPADIIDRIRENWNQRFLSCYKNESLFIIMRITESYVDIRKTIIEKVNELTEILGQKYPKNDFAIGVGHCYEEVANISAGFYSAKLALTGYRPRGRITVTQYDDMGIYKILFDLKNRDALYSIHKNTIGRLRDYDTENNAEAERTIKAYLNNFCSVQQTAKELFVRYNTVRYRLNKVKEDLGWDLTDIDTCLYLNVAFRTDDFLSEQDNTN